MADTVVEAVRKRLLVGQNLNWWKGDKVRLSKENIKELDEDFDIEYRPRHKRFYNLRPQTQKSISKVGEMPKCTNCIDKGVVCSGPTNPSMRMCAQCAVDGLTPDKCVYLDDSLKLSLPAWYGRGQVAAGGGAGGAAGGAANVPIQPAVPNRAGAGLAAIRRPLGRGSPTGIMENENVNEENVNEENENEVNSNASRDPYATAEQIAAGRAKKQKRRNNVARKVAESALDNMAAGNESAKAVQAMAKAAGAGGKRSRKQKQKNLKRKQKFTRKQK